MRLTDEGAAYHRHVLPALEALRDAERTLSTGRVAPSGRLRITAPDFFGAEPAFAEVLAEYMRLYPGVELEVECTNRRVDLLAEGFDLAIRAGHLADSSLVSRRLGRPQQARLYASPGYLRARGTPRRAEELVHHDCLVLGGAPRAWPLRRNRRVTEVPVHVRAAASGFELLRALALAGHGVARLPAYLADEDVRRGALRTVLDALAPPPLPLHVVYPSARHLPVKLRKLLELLAARFP